jgi:hypothetical protein
LRAIGIRDNLRLLWLKNFFAWSANCRKSDANAIDTAVPANPETISVCARMASTIASPAGKHAICKHSTEESDDPVIGDRMI